VKTFMRRLLLVIVVLAIAGAVTVMMWPRPIEVDAAVAEVGQLLVSINEEGQTRIRERYVISSPLSGRLRRVTLDPGDAVSSGSTVVAVIDPTSPELLDPRAVAEAEARVRAAEATVRRSDSLRRITKVKYDRAETDLGRIAQSHEQGAATVTEIDDARSDERAAAERLRAASFDEEIARYELDVARAALLYAQGSVEGSSAGGMSLRSPINGVVLRAFQESVSVVTPGEPLLEVGDLRDLEIVIDVLSTDGVRVSQGDRVVIEHWGGDEVLEARVRLVEPSAFTHVSALGIEEQRVNVIADFVSPFEERRALGDQYRVDARILIWSDSDALSVPSSAVFRSGENWDVFVIAQGRVEQRRVGVGKRNGVSTQILSGLAEGERVVIYPSDQLSNGSRVRLR